MGQDHGIKEITMIIADNNKITIVRGNTGSLDVGVNIVTNNEEEEYELEEGDKLIFRMSKTFQGEPLIEKEIENGILGFAPEDTEDLPFGEYFYDVTLEADGLVDTIIQADDKNPNFIIAKAVPHGTD